MNHEADKLSVGAYSRRLSHYLAEKGIGDIALAEVEFPLRQGSRLNAQRHTPDAGAASVGAEKFGSKLRLVERMIRGDTFLIGDSVTIADCVAMALLQFADEVYAVSRPEDCVKLAAWYQRFLQRPSAPSYVYPNEIISLSRGLPKQSGCVI